MKNNLSPFPIASSGHDRFIRNVVKNDLSPFQLYQVAMIGLLKFVFDSLYLFERIVCEREKYNEFKL